jgi:Predicted dehydrogenases and related proteins
MIRTGVYGSIDSSTVGMVENILDVAELDVVGMYSAKPEHGDTKLHLREFDEEGAFLNNVDAVIAVSPATSLEEIKTLVKSSKHVFFEPASSYCSTDVTKLSSIVDEANVKVQAGFHHRFNNTFLSAKPFIVSPRFIQSVNHRRFNSNSEYCSVLMDMLINDVDIVLSVVKSNVKNIYASASAITQMPSVVPDVINARIEFYNGCVAHFVASRIAEDDSHKMTFYCRDSYTNIDMLANKASLVKKRGDVDDPSFFSQSVGDLSVEQIMVKPNNVYYDEFTSFAKSILYNKSPEVNVDTILKTYEVVKKIKDKIKLGF